LDIPSELMKDNELLKAENCWWDNGITKRGGISTYSTTDFTAMVGFKGSIRCYINTTWYTIIAIDDNTDIRFYAGTGTTFAEIDATFTFTRGTNVEMAELLGHVVMVNGVDKPAVVYWDSAPADAIFSCAYLSIYNTQYLTQILQDERPHLVRAHNSQIYMASYNIVNFSPPYYVTGWREGQSEHFDMGGSKIMDMVSFADTLVVGKENTLYTWSTSNLMDPIRSRPLTTVGPIASRSMVQIGNYVTFVARDGIYMWDGSNITKLSKHIKTDFDSWTNTSASAAVYNNHCLISFPDDSVVLVFDPDTFRLDDMGDGRVSFYKWTGYKATQLLNCNGAGDTGYLLAVVDQDDPYVARGDYGTQDNILAAVNIEMNCQTKYFSDGNYQVLKGFGRLKVKVKEVSDRAGARHRVTMYSDDGVRYEHAFMLVPKGTGYYTEDIRVPYTISGTLYGFGLRHNAPTSATLTGFTIENFERSY